MNIAIYLNNEAISDVDCSNIEKGNPGIGGTQYSILLLTVMLRKKYKDLSTFLFSPKKVHMVDERLNYTIDSSVDLLNKVEALQCEILILTSLAFGNELTKDFISELDKRNIKTIVWGHNFYYKDLCDRIAESSMIKANVFVGRQQYDKYIDHKLILKSTYIYNMYPLSNTSVERNKIQHIVTYIGSLVPSKGFHILAKYWPQILESVPDAELFVIGSGKLYNRSATLGKYGIADENYEKSFIKYLINEDGSIKSSVHFMGVLGEEKNEIIKKTSVGIVNPSGKTETFGISALDFSSMSIPVVTIAKGGFLDTIIDEKTGLLYKKYSDFPKKVIELLENTEKNKTLGENAKAYATEFCPDEIIKEWYDLIIKVKDDKNMPFIQPENHYLRDFKLIRILLHNFNSVSKYKHAISMIGIESRIKEIISKFR